MKLWILFDYRLPHDGVNALQVMKTAEALCRINDDTTLIVPTGRGCSDVPTGTIHTFFGMPPSVRILQVPCIQGRIGALRIEKWAHPWNVLQTIPDRPDLVLTRNIPTALLTMRQSIPTFVETFRSARGKNAVLHTIFRKMHRNPALRGMITHSEWCAETLREGRPRLDKVFTIHNGCDASLLNSTMPPQEARTINGLPERRTVLYAGHTRADKGIDILFEMAARLPEVNFMLVGYRDETQASLLKTRVNRDGLSNVHLYPWVHQRQLPPFLFAADLAIIPPTSAPFRSGNTGLPLKTFDYLGSGRPVIAPDVNDVKPLLRHGENAWLVPPDDAHAAAVAVRFLLSTPELLTQLALGAKETGAAHTWDLRARRLMMLFQNSARS